MQGWFNSIIPKDVIYPVCKLKGKKPYGHLSRHSLSWKIGSNWTRYTLKRIKTPLLDKKVCTRNLSNLKLTCATLEVSYLTIKKSKDAY